MKRLSEYSFPQDLKHMEKSELEELSQQIRDFLVASIAKTGGHLASNLGVVDLTIALHKVFDSPRDRILWDVGHQSYVHKILTGRMERFDTLRQYQGLSGFPKRSESDDDVYDAGHSSDSISVTLGIAQARDMDGDDFHVVTVIGDGALTGGIAFEALNNASTSQTKIIIVINDNQMSISRNVGGLTQHLNRLRVSHGYIGMKKRIKKQLTGGGRIRRALFHGMERVRDRLRSAILPESLFENLGFKYYGPIDGHNIGELLEFLDSAREIDSPVILHVMTKKGNGVPEVEANPDRYHGVSPYDPVSMNPLKSGGHPSWSQVFGEQLTWMAEWDPRIVAVSAAMMDGTGLSTMQKAFPSRVFDVGIAEQHAVSFATGLALQGKRPFVAIYSTFLQRAYDEMMINVCMQKLPVVFCIDRAGNVGDDGETHNGQFDLSYLSHMPNLRILAPSSDQELKEMMRYALQLGEPCAIRYPRGSAWKEDAEEIPEMDGSCRVLRKGSDVLILSVGKCRASAWNTAQRLDAVGISCGVVDVRFVKPMDETGIREAMKGVRVLATMEDNVVTGGFGSAVSVWLESERERPQVCLHFGWPDSFVPAGKTPQLEEIYGLDVATMAETIQKAWQDTTQTSGLSF